MAHSSEPWDVARALQTYNIARWGSGYFGVNDAGSMTVRPVQDQGPAIDLMSVVEEARDRGLTFPLLLRFQDLLRHRVQVLNEEFKSAIAEAGYQAPYRGVFPIKVNQLREVVEEIMDAGAPYKFGIEVGSKPELFAALAIHRDPESLLICNGYKDSLYIQMALLGRKLGKTIIMVVEKVEELKAIVDVSQQIGVRPIIGVRVRLLAKSSGKWATSGGENAKFGLSTSEVMEATELLRANQMEDCLKLLHFHIGSQIPDIQTVKRAVREGARYYAKLKQLGFALEYLDVGGGLGVDYDGSRRRARQQRELHARRVRARRGLQRGRRLQRGEGRASHAGERERPRHRRAPLGAHRRHLRRDREDEGQALRRAGGREAGQAGGRPAGAARHAEPQEPARAFPRRGADQGRRAGALRSRPARPRDQGAGGDAFLGDRRGRGQALPRREDDAGRNLRPEGFPRRPVPLQLLGLPVAADHWALGQLFPIVPIHRLNEAPEHNGTLVDITCDSDGKIAKFIDSDSEVSNILPLHALNGKPYYLGIFLLGAYQDIMGDLHNLFGPRERGAHLPRSRRGERLLHRGDDPGQPRSARCWQRPVPHHDAGARDEEQIDRAIKADVLKPNEGMRLLESYEQGLKTSTYLQF